MGPPMAPISKIKKLFVFTCTGLMLFEHSFDGMSDRLNSNLFGGFVSAIQSLSEQMTGGKGRLEAFNMGDSKFHFYLPRGEEMDYVYFVVQSDIKADKEVQKTLRIIEEKWRVLYPPSFIKAWDGNTTIFETFTNEIKSLFVDPTEKMKASFW